MANGHAIASKSRNPAGHQAHPAAEPQSGGSSRLASLQRALGNQAFSQVIGPSGKEPALGSGVPPSVLSALSSPGRPIDPHVRRPLESAYGMDFSYVRVHTGEDSSDSARAMRARAFTVGRDVVFGRNQYAPNTARGRILLSHELAHVVQQRSAAPAELLSTESKNGSAEHEARLAGLQAAHNVAPATLSALGSQRIQLADEDELSFLDGFVANNVGSAVMGEFGWKFFRELARGFAGGFKGELAAGKGHDLLEKFKALVTSPTSFLKFYGGYLWGLVQGLVSPLVDLWHLIRFAFEVQVKAFQWVMNRFKDPGKLAAQVAEISGSIDRLQKKMEEAFKNFFEHPVETAKKVSGWLDAMMNAALGKARQAGHSLAESLFEFLAQPPYELGVSIGKAVGAIIANVLLLVFTESIGNALTAAGRLLAEAGEWLAAKVSKVLNLLKSAVQGLAKMFSAVKGTALKFMEGVAEEAIALFNKIVKFFELPELETGLAAAGDAPPGALLAEGAKAPPGTPPPRTSPATVEDLVGKGRNNPPAAAAKPAPVPEGVAKGEKAQEALIKNQQKQLKEAIDKGGAAEKGRVLDEQGKVAEEITRDTLKEVPGSTVEKNVKIGVGEGSEIDNVITKGTKRAFVEMKLTIADAAPRTVNQLTNAVRVAGPKDIVILQVARNPTAAEIAALEKALGKEVFGKVKIVSSQTELFRLVKLALE